MTTQPELDIHDHIRELTVEHSQREDYEWQEATWNGHAFVPHGPIVSKVHWVKIPALIVQLEGARDILGSEGEQGGRGAPTSKPATRLEAIDMLALIDRECAAWLEQLGATTIPANTVRRLNRLHGLYPAAGAGERAELEGDVKSWWHQARIVTGWDMPAFKPTGARCPVCETTNTLRVKLDGALCVEAKCRTRWDATEVGLLGEHVRTEMERIAAEKAAAQDEEGRLASA
jgi:hypothetical protein